MIEFSAFILDFRLRLFIGGRDFNYEPIEIVDFDRRLLFALFLFLCFAGCWTLELRKRQFDSFSRTSLENRNLELVDDATS